MVGSNALAPNADIAKVQAITGGQIHKSLILKE